MTSSMPGRSTFTATSRPSCSVAKCTCAMEALATGSASKLANRPPRLAGRVALDDGARLCTGERRHLVLQLGQFVGDVRRHQVAPGGQHLAELDEDRPQVLQRQSQPLTTRSVVGAAQSQQAGQQAQAAVVAQLVEHQLVHAVAQHHPGDQGQAGPVSHAAEGETVEG
jgi:hypothetical protein